MSNEMPMHIQQLTQSVDVYQKIANTLMQLYQTQEAQGKAIVEAKDIASKAYDSICIYDYEKGELKNILIGKVELICRRHNLSPKRGWYQDFWKSINTACGVPSYHNIKRKDFAKAKSIAEQWLPKFLRDN